MTSSWKKLQVWSRVKNFHGISFVIQLLKKVFYEVGIYKAECETIFQITSAQVRVALQVARKIAVCNSTLRRAQLTIAKKMAACQFYHNLLQKVDFIFLNMLRHQN